MTLRLPDRWMWDFWFAEDGDEVHVFHLQAPRSLGDPELRHLQATVGHAVSTDLRTWTPLPTALEAGAPGAFDDMATWTGCVFRHDGRWLMFHTGLSRADGGRVQRIGAATSTDLLRWERRPDALVTADPRWYETVEGGARETPWRDPWVFRDEATGLFHMLVCARATAGPDDGRGVIGHAWSADLERWEVGPPRSEPGEFYHLEVPQLVRVRDDAWWLLFSVPTALHSAARRERPGVAAEGGTHYLTSRDPLGPFALEREDFLVGDPDTRHYAGRMLRHRGQWWFFAFHAHGDELGPFAGALSDPIPVSVSPTGQPVVHIPEVSGLPPLRERAG